MSVSVRNPQLGGFGKNLVLTALSPFQKLYHEFLQSTTHFWSKYVWLVGVSAENENLLDRVELLEAKNLELLEIKKENSRLRTILDFKEENSLDGLAAKVISRGFSEFVSNVVIDKGSVDGIEIGMPVIDGSSAVGQVTYVASHFSNVLLLNDLSSSVDAILQESRIRGIVEGSLDRKIFLKYVGNDEQIEIGQRVITSGYDLVYPKGLAIGVVIGVEKSDIGMFKNIEISSSANFDKLEDVFVLRRKDSGEVVKILELHNKGR